MKVLDYSFLFVCHTKEIHRLLNGEEWVEELCCNQSGVLDAMCMWFRLKVGDVWLDTGPEVESCWEQAIYLGRCQDLFFLKDAVQLAGCPVPFALM